MEAIDSYVALYMVGLAVALFAPVGILLAVAWLNLRSWREPRDPMKRLRKVEQGRRAQASQYDPSRDPRPTAGNGAR